MITAIYIEPINIALIKKCKNATTKIQDQRINLVSNKILFRIIFKYFNKESKKVGRSLIKTQNKKGPR